ncbi:unnamed protein product [Rhodiola kirilowii]
MTILAWNCRGLGTPLAIRALQDVVRTSKSPVVGLIETKATKEKCEQVRVKLGFKSCFSVPARGKSGGLALLWKAELEVTVLNFSFHHIDFIVHSTAPFRATLFYGAPKATDRTRGWALIRKLKSLSDLPWCLLGDFNEILRYSDTTRNAWRRHTFMIQFRSVLAECNLSEIGFKGSRFTYTNRRKGAEETRCHLDRVVADLKWKEMFPDAFVYHISTFHSDHCPIQLCLSTMVINRSRLFRFEFMWTRDQRVREVISKHWASSAGDQNLLWKLDHLKGPLRRWNKKVFGNVHDKLDSLRADLKCIKAMPRTDDTASKEAEISSELNEWLLREELMWQQRSRVHWLKEGDNNTTFFHRKANARRKTNTIVQLRNGEGELCFDQTSFENIAVQYFCRLFASNTPMPEADRIKEMDFLPRVVTPEHNRVLTETYTEREVFAALSQLHPSKAPGLDGFPAGFFQKYWDIIKRDFLELCLSILNCGVIPANLNDTLLVLIPKQKRIVERMEDLRPISLTSVISKVVAKVFVNRLQDILPEVIGTAQSAFVKGRLISDNFILAHECAHFIKNTKKGNQFFASLKLDMSKAYDRVEWSFLESVLLQFGFDDGWVSKIMSYVRSVRYCVRINGANSEFFTPSRGLRQGDPLSPYLFILCMEWLSRKLYSLQENKTISGIRICRGAPSISHLFFADDVLLLFKVEGNTASVIKSVLATYEQLSGQTVNLDKSTVVFSPNVPNEITTLFYDTFQVNIAACHGKYLGLPLSLNRKWSTDFLEVVDRFWAKTSSWNNATLFCGGKEILIKSVLQAIPQYFMHCFMLPESVVNRLQAIISRFWWSQKMENRPMHWVSNTVLMKDKLEGGLGFKDLKLVNLSLLAKQAWRIYQNPNLLLSQVLKARYFKSTDILYASPGWRPSKVWQSISKSLGLLRFGCEVDDSGAHFWKHRDSKNYDVASGYKLALSIRDMEKPQFGECSDTSKLKKFWNLFWKLPTSRKVKIFGWRCYHNGLSLGSNLYIRQLRDNVSCPFCNYKFESANHVFLQCWWSSAVWAGAGIDELKYFAHCSSMADVIFYFTTNLKPDKAALCLTTIWYIWYVRNKYKHGDVSVTPCATSLRVKILAADYLKYSKSNAPNHFTISDFEWNPPQPGVTKINCDAAWDEESRTGSVAAIARDAFGHVLGIRTLHNISCGSSFICEGIGLNEGFNLAKHLKVSAVAFEVDCAEVVSSINCRNKDAVKEMEWYRTCVLELESNPGWTIFLIRREANVEADKIARYARSKRWSWTRLDACPRAPFVEQ